jgi:hypothetical protein
LAKPQSLGRRQVPAVQVVEYSLALAGLAGAQAKQMNFHLGPPATLGSSAAAQVRLSWRGSRQADMVVGGTRR